MARSLNKVLLIGNLTRNPELRYTQSGKPVCNIRLATNRTYLVENGEKQEQTEYHTIILWGKLAETASEYLHKGEKAYFQGRLQTRSFTGKDGIKIAVTEIIAEDMLMLGGKSQAETHAKATSDVAKALQAVEEGAETSDQAGENAFDVKPEEIPF